MTAPLPHTVELQYGPLHRFSLHCQADGHPQPAVTWYRNGYRIGRYIHSELTLVLLGSVVGNNSVKVFSSPAPEDAGYYQCEVRRTLQL